jgi:hypothetical protein
MGKTGVFTQDIKGGFLFPMVGWDMQLTPHAYLVSAQSDLQESLSDEIRGHAWASNAKRIAGMVSATGEGQSDILVDSAHEALGKKLSFVWLTGK